MQAGFAQLTIPLAEESFVTLAHALGTLEDERTRAREASLLRRSVAGIARGMAGFAVAAVEILICNESIKI